MSFPGLFYLPTHPPARLLLHALACSAAVALCCTSQPTNQPTNQVLHPLLRILMTFSRIARGLSCGPVFLPDVRATQGRVFLQGLQLTGQRPEASRRRPSPPRHHHCPVSDNHHSTVKPTLYQIHNSPKAHQTPPSCHWHRQANLLPLAPVAN